jgi:hypothetical protein
MTQIPVAGLHAELALGTAKLQSGVSDADRLLNRLQEKMTGTGRKARKTGDDIDSGIGKGLKGAAASASAFERRMDFLQKRFDPLYAASKRYESELRLLDEAQKRGAISGATYARNLDRLNAELAGVDTGLAAATAQMGRFNGYAKGMSAQTGNISAQFQDIGVQLAGGQSPFLIALQQGTQLTGVFAQMGGGIRQVGPALIGAFASLLSPLSLATIGVIAFGGAIVQWFTGSEKKAKSLEEAVSDVSTAVSDLQRITDLLDDTDLTGIREQFGGLTADVVQLLSLQRELALMDAMRGIADAISAARKSMDGWITSGLDGIRIAFDTTYDDASLIQMLMEEVAKATTPQEALERTVALRKELDDFPLNRITDEGYEFVRALAEGENALRQVLVQAERSETALGSARLEAERLAVPAPGAGWMGTAIKETNLLIGRLIEARQQRDVLLAAAASARYDNLLANSGQSSGPDSVRSRLGGGGAFAPPVRGAGLPFSGAAGRSGAGGGGGGGGGLSDLAREVDRLNAATADGRAPLEKYRAELAKLNDLKKNGLTEAAYSKEAARLNEELAGSLPLVGDVADAFGAFVARGFKDFKGFTKSVLGSFQKLLGDMIATAARNRIMIALGIGGGGFGGTLANAATGAMGGGGILGSLLGSFGGRALAGGSGLLGGLGNALGGGFGNILNIGGNAAAAGGGLMAGIGAAAPVIGAVALIASALKKKVTELDSGVQVNASGLDTAVETFRTLETKRFFGLSRKTSTTTSAASAEVAGPISEAVAQIRSGALESAKSLGVGADAFAQFQYSLKISLKGLTEQAAQAKIQEALAGLGNAFAGLTPDLTAFQKNGEGALDALTRLSSSLGTVNATFQDIGLRLFDVSVAGGGAAAAFADLLGGLENFQAVTAAYYDGFFTDAEKTARIQGRLAEEFAKLGLSLPQTRDAFRALVDSADAAGNRDLVAKLLGLSGAFAQITVSADDAAQAAAQAAEDAAQAAAQAAEDAAQAIEAALGRLKEEDFAAALDFGRARAALAYGGGLPQAPVYGAGSMADPAQQAVRNDSLFTAINNRLAQIERYFTRWDIDGLPPERAA